MKNSIIIFLFMVSFPASSQSLQERYAQSKKAYENKDFVSFLKQTKTLDSIRPSHPLFTYNLAVAYAVNGFKNESITVLKKAILMNNETNFETDKDFLNFAESNEFKQLIQLKSDLNKPLISSEKVVSLSEKDLHPEGLVFLPKNNMWLATSIHKRKILSFDPVTGICTDWLKLDDMLAVFALKSDTNEKYLWVATSAIPEMLRFSKELDGNAELLKIEIATRKIVKRFKAEGAHVFGDLAVSKTGDIFISDSASPLVYIIKNDELSIWLNLEKQAFNLQGITFNADFSKLYIADYLKGIICVPIKRPQDFKWLKFPEATTFKGIDGLVFYKNSLIAIQNGVNPIRVMRYYLDNSDNITGFKVFDHNRAEFNEPALASIKGNKLYFFANSPWKAYDKSFELNLEAFDNPMLFHLKLE